MTKSIEFHQLLPGPETGIGVLEQLSPYIRHCGDSLRPPWKLQNRKLLDYLVVYIEYGRGLFVIDGKSYPTEPHDIFFIPPNTLHHMEGYDPEMHCIYVHFDLTYQSDRVHWDFSIPSGMTDLSDFEKLRHPDLTIEGITDLPFHIQGWNNAQAGQLLADICREADTALPFSQIAMSGLMLQFFAEIIRGQRLPRNSGAAHHKAIEKVADSIRLHPERDSPVDLLAAQTFLSESHFRLLFSKLYHCSPQEYRHKARIRKAKMLMLDSPMNLSEIADALGYATVQNFSRAFKRTEGISPSLYRNRVSGTAY